MSSNTTARPSQAGKNWSKLRQRDAEALENFASLPDEAHVRVGVYAKLRGVSVPTIWRGARKGTLPKPKKLGPKTTAWRVGDVRADLAAVG